MSGPTVNNIRWMPGCGVLTMQDKQEGLMLLRAYAPNRPVPQYQSTMLYNLVESVELANRAINFMMYQRNAK